LTVDLEFNENFWIDLNTGEAAKIYGGVASPQKQPDADPEHQPNPEQYSSPIHPPNRSSGLLLLMHSFRCRLLISRQMSILGVSLCKRF
jgi:hypothetical protein